jgi:hypothetical protein
VSEVTTAKRFCSELTGFSRPQTYADVAFFSVDVLVGKELWDNIMQNIPPNDCL